jgi:hypothetical protein
VLGGAARPCELGWSWAGRGVAGAAAPSVADAGERGCAKAMPGRLQPTIREGRRWAATTGKDKRR